MIKQTKAITLIALIITIIVLLILAAITINMVLGDNGLFNKAKTSVAKYENAQENEESLLNEYQNMININSESRDETNRSMYGIPSVTGNGTEVDPYIINTANQLAIFSGAVTSGYDFAGKFVKLGNNIDLSTICGESLNISWTPIGSGDVAFQGTFDGNGKSISNLYINSSKFVNCGLFGNVGTNGIVKNLKLEGAYVCNNNSSREGVSAIYTAGIVAFNNGIIEKCANIITNSQNQIYGYLNNTTNTARSNWVGGIAGMNQGTIKECYNTNNIKAKSERYNTYAHIICGGIAAWSRSGQIINCYNISNINTEGVNSISVGGIVGDNCGSNRLKNCYSASNITSNLSNSIVGGICGRNYSDQGATISDTYYETKSNISYSYMDGTSGNTTTTSNKSSNELKADAMIPLLNNGLSKPAWGKDTSNENNGYPILI